MLKRSNSSSDACGQKQCSFGYMYKSCVNSNWTTYIPFNYHFPQSPGHCQVKSGFIHIKTICSHVANLRNLKICVGKTWFIYPIICYTKILLFFSNLNCSKGLLVFLQLGL